MIGCRKGLFFVVFSFFIHAHIAFGQQVNWREEACVRNSLSEYIEAVKNREKVMGWRIQFFSTTDRRTMETTLKTLKQKYPGVPFTWIFKDPLYQVRAGAFLYKKDAAPLQHLLKKEFAGAFPIQDEIEVLELLYNH